MRRATPALDVASIPCAQLITMECWQRTCLPQPVVGVAVLVRIRQHGHVQRLDRNIIPA